MRLRPELSVEKAKFVGRLLALSLKSNVALGWSLSEPLARLLVYPRLPELLRKVSKWQRLRAVVQRRGGKQASRWDEVLMLAAVGFDLEGWFSVVAPESAKWYFACLDERKPQAERTTLMEVLDEPPTEEGLPVTVELLRERMAQRCRSELLHKVALPLEAMWAAFRSVPGVEIPMWKGGTPQRLGLEHAKSSDWPHFAGAVAGEPHLDVAQWRQHTDVEPASKADMVTVDLFWTYVAGLSNVARANLFFWASACKRLPHGGWAAMPQRMTLNVGADPNRLPVAHTCPFQIDLPPYSTAAMLSERLTLAMQNTKFLLV